MAAKQLTLFEGPLPTVTDERAREAARKKRKTDANRKAFFAGRASALAAQPKSAELETLDPKLREKILNLLSAPDARIAKVAKRAGVSEQLVRELVADDFDRRRAVREAIDITRALGRERVTRRAPRLRGSRHASAAARA